MLTIFATIPNGAAASVGPIGFILVIQNRQIFTIAMSSITKNKTVLMVMAIVLPVELLLYVHN